jgi:hypothetical protein
METVIRDGVVVFEGATDVISAPGTVRTDKYAIKSVLCKDMRKRYHIHGNSCGCSGVTDRKVTFTTLATGSSLTVYNGIWLTISRDQMAHMKLAEAILNSL